MAHPLHLAFYADDFTGATDALASLALAGLRTRLFLAPPTPAQLARHRGLQAIGVAGLTRSLPPAAMARTLRPAFTALRRLRPRHVLYKVCSTFDSSPTVGSIGRAIEVGRAVFGRRTVPLLVAAPALGRYCVFGQLFARFGIGSDGAIHRLDRHPSVSRHPVTPMTEADLRRHLARQTKLRTGLLDILDLRRPAAAARASLDRLIGSGSEIILFDALEDTDLARLGLLLSTFEQPDQPLFSVGSSGLGTALCCTGKFPPVPREADYRNSALPLSGSPARKRRDDAPAPRLSGSPAREDRVSADHRLPLLVLSGSCSPVTAGQIDHALAHGFTGIAIDPARPGSPPRKGRDRSRLRSAAERILSALRAGRSVVAYTARGPARGQPLSPAVLGAALGRLAREVLTAVPLRRLVLAGGDTSSYAARALGIESVELLARFVPGAPLCRAHAPGSPADRLEINFKGGQVGAPDYFTRAAASPLPVALPGRAGMAMRPASFPPLPGRAR